MRCFSRFPLYSYVLILLFLVGFTGGCGQTSPKASMQSYINALKAQKYKQAWRFISRQSQENIAGLPDKNGYESFKEKIEESLNDPGMKAQLFSSTVDGEHLEGDRATVTVRFTEDKRTSSTQEITLVKEDRDWKIKF
jgi:hypothetical protein